MNKMCKGFKNNDYLFLIFQMPFFKHCIFSIFKLLIFLFLLSIFLFLHLWITGFLHFTFAVPLYLKNYLTTETQFLYFRSWVYLIFDQPCVHIISSLSWYYKSYFATLPSPWLQSFEVTFPIVISTEIKRKKVSCYNQK